MQLEVYKRLLRNGDDTWDVICLHEVGVGKKMMSFLLLAANAARKAIGPNREEVAKKPAIPGLGIVLQS